MSPLQSIPLQSAPDQSIPSAPLQSFPSQEQSDAEDVTSSPVEAVHLDAEPGPSQVDQGKNGGKKGGKKKGKKRGKKKRSSGDDEQLYAVTKKRNELRRKKQRFESEIKKLKERLLAGGRFKRMACGVSIILTILLEMPSEIKPLLAAFLNKSSLTCLLTSFKLEAAVDELEAVYDDVISDFRSRGIGYIEYTLANNPENPMAPQIQVYAAESVFPANYYDLTASLVKVSQQMNNLII